MKNLVQRFCVFSRAKQIAIVTFFLHFVCICALSIHHFVHSKKVIKTKITVRTVRSVIPKTTTSEMRSSTASHPQTNLKTPSTQKTKKDSTKSSSQISKTSKAPPKINSVKETLLKEIAENLEIVHSEKQSSTLRPELSLPTFSRSMSQQIQIEETDVIDLNYNEILIAFLQDQLDLPEYGEVKVRLEINAQGHLNHLEILEVQNRRNGEFIKTRLAELRFPPCVESKPFTITFKNKTQR